MTAAAGRSLGSRRAANASTAPTRASAAASSSASPKRVAEPFAPRERGTAPAMLTARAAPTSSAVTREPVPSDRPRSGSASSRAAGPKAAYRKTAAPPAASTPNRKSQRSSVSVVRLRDTGLRDDSGAARPRPTAKANTPWMTWPSSEITLHRTL